MINIAKRIKEVRKKLGFNTQREFSTELNIPTPTLQKYEQGKVTIPHTFLEILNKKLNVSIDWILTGQGEIFLPNEKELKIINGNNNNVVVGGGINKSFNNHSEEMEKSIIKDIVNTLNKVHDDNLLNYINSEIVALVNRIQTKEKYGSSFGG